MNLKIRLLSSETIGITVNDEMKMRDFRITVADHSLKEPDQIRLSLNRKDLIDKPENENKSVKECGIVSGDVIYVHDAATLQIAPSVPSQTKIFVSASASPLDSQNGQPPTSSSHSGISPYKNAIGSNNRDILPPKKPLQQNQRSSKPNGDETCHILRIPVEVLNKILFNLNVTSLRNLCLTCKTLYRSWLTDEHVWHRLLRRDFNVTNPKQVYKEKFIERRRQRMSPFQPAVVPQPQPQPFNPYDNPPQRPLRNQWPGIIGGNQDLNPFHNPQGPEIGPRIFPRQPGPGQPQRPRFPNQNPPDFGGFFPDFYN